MQPDEPTSLATEEYRALRATIRERGTLRLFVIVLTFVAWSALVLAAGPPLSPAVALVALVALAAGFETVLAAHIGVERVGRYLQHRYETTQAGPGWEHAAMRLGSSRLVTPSPDPLAARLFIVAAGLNAGLSSLGQDWDGPLAFGLLLQAVALSGHVSFVGRVLTAKRRAARQRDDDLGAFASITGHQP